MRLHVKLLLWAFLGIFTLLLIVWTVNGWEPKVVSEDQNVFMPGSQPHDVGTFESPDECDNCHGGYDEGAEPDYNWRGSMMAQAARDPLWLACLTVSNQDSINVVGNPNAGDICIRCHSPTGWLEGRSDPPNTASLEGDDLWGVQCDFCHKMIDPFTANNQTDVSPDTDDNAKNLALEIYQKDIEVLSTIELFNGSKFFNISTGLPVNYGNGEFPNYIEGGGGQFFIDPGHHKRGPRHDGSPSHDFYYSRFHSSKYFCQSCHDVSNPVLASVKISGNTPEVNAPQTFFHVERTSSEFMLSAYGRGGAEANIPGVSFANKCQDCHMRDVVGKGVSFGANRDDLALHDLTGGNQWMLKILASVDLSYTGFDEYNYNILSGEKYEGATIDVDGLQSYGDELVSGSDRSIHMLESAAELSITDEDTSSATIRVQNNGGHKLISGFPEGRRMFLDVKFFDSTGNQIGEINPYTPLVTSQDENGNEVYVSGGYLTETDEKLVWECELSSSITGESKTFHFALGDDRNKDNRIPPKGFDTEKMFERIAQPRWEGTDAPNYFTQAEYAGGYDDVTIIKPAGTDKWYATLYYQTTSKEYIEFLRDEINGDASTLPSEAYIAQTDPFFSNLKGWGDGIYDLWLHNGGAAPVLMETIGDVPSSACTVDTPQNLVAEEVGSDIVLTWDPVADADGYDIYRSLNGEYTQITSVEESSLTITDLGSSQEYCYTVTSYRICEGDTIAVSGRSNVACVTITVDENKIRLGPILDEDGEPVENARMAVIIDGVQYSERTDEDGLVSIELEDQPSRGTYTVNVSKTDYENIAFEITIDAQGGVSQQVAIPALIEAEDEFETNVITIVTGIIVLVIFILMVMLFMWQKTEETMAESEQRVEDEPAGELACPDCGALVGFDEKVCPECGEEFEEEIYNCDICGEELQPDSKTCEKCGASNEEKN